MHEVLVRLPFYQVSIVVQTAVVRAHKYAHRLDSIRLRRLWQGVPQACSVKAAYTDTQQQQQHTKHLFSLRCALCAPFQLAGTHEGTRERPHILLPTVQPAVPNRRRYAVASEATLPRRHRCTTTPRQCECQGMQFILYPVVLSHQIFYFLHLPNCILGYFQLFFRPIKHYSKQTLLYFTKTTLFLSQKI